MMITAATAIKASPTTTAMTPPVNINAIYSRPLEGRYFAGSRGIGSDQIYCGQSGIDEFTGCIFPATSAITTAAGSSEYPQQC